MEQINHNQRVAILIDGNNIERSLKAKFGNDKMLNYQTYIPYILRNRGLTFFDYFVEGVDNGLKTKFHSQLDKLFFGNIHRCHKSADVPISMHAAKIYSKVDTVIILSGDADYCDTVDHLKSNGVRVEVCCVFGTGSKVLLEKANSYEYIQDRDTYTLETVKMPMSKEEFNAKMSELESNKPI